MLQFQQHVFGAFVFTNGVTCPALWRHLSSHPRQFSIFEDVGGWQPCPFHLWTNECNKIDTRLTENRRSRQNGPGRSNMASKPWNRLAYRMVTNLCTVHKKTQIVCVLLRRNAISAWNTFNLRLSEAKMGFPQSNFRMSKHSSEKARTSRHQLTNWNATFM